MNVGFIGLGKLGLPMATAMAQHHHVVGYDIDESRMSKAPTVYGEAGPDGTGDFNDWLISADDLTFGSMREACEQDIVFVAVQTPHEPQFEGIHPLGTERADFDYSFLKEAVRDIEAYLTKPKPVVIVSTVLPGTCRRELLPLLHHGQLVYNPAFAAMGTVMRDFLDPEFVLAGYPEIIKHSTITILEQFYCDVFGHDLPDHDRRFQHMSLESAELTKVAYNTFITAKICFANTIMECADAVGANCDDVTNALSLATRRLISPAYLRGGMGDGGACHPRDNIAMSWFADEHKLKFNLFDQLIWGRERQAVALCLKLEKAGYDNDLPFGICGVAFKANSAITTGSAALLAANWMQQDYSVDLFDPIVGGSMPDKPYALLIGCNHDAIIQYEFPKGSVIIDPWGCIPDQEGVEVIRIGRS